MKKGKEKRKQSAAQLANLKPVKLGEIRNPLGINRKRPWTETYSQIGERLYPEVLRHKFNAEIGAEILMVGATFRKVNAVRRMLEATQVGGTSAAKEIVDRIEGKAMVYEEEKVDAKEAHVYLVVGNETELENAKPVTGSVEITGGTNEPDHRSSRGPGPVGRE